MHAFTSSVELDRTDLQVAAVVLLAAGAVLPLIHLQLPFLGHQSGLPCPLRTITGIPCPLCGITTSIESTLRLQLRSAVSANPAGTLLVAAALAFLAARPRRVSVPALLPLASLGLMWLFELHRYSIL